MSDRSLDGEYAGFLTRAFGLVLDYVIISLTVAVLGLGTMLLFNLFGVDLGSCRGVTASKDIAGLVCTGGQWFLLAAVATVSPFYYILFWMLVGQTIGQRVMGVRVARLDGHNIGFKRSLVRWIGAQICVLTLGIGFLWVLVDDRRMGWHDIMARTCVLYSWKAVQKERVVARLKGRMRRTGVQQAPVEAAQGVEVTPGSAGPN